MNRILITAASSCSGIHAARLLHATGSGELHGTSRHGTKLPHLQACHRCDFCKASDVFSTVAQVEPDIVLHLAASADHSRPAEMIQANVSGVMNLLAACQQLAKPTKVLLVGSAASFGDMSDDETGLDGSRRPVPTSLYGVSRQAQMEIGRVIDGRSDVQVFLCRTFNLIGPGISDRYAPAAIAQRIAAAHQNGRADLEVRDLDAVRDYIDVRDAVAAYLRILAGGRSGYPYSVGRGEPVTVRLLTETILSESGIEIRIVEQSGTVSNPRSQIGRSIADRSDLTRDTGWTPTIPLVQSVRDMLEDQKAAHEAVR